LNNLGPFRKLFTPLVFQAWLRACLRFQDIRVAYNKSQFLVIAFMCRVITSYCKILNSVETRLKLSKTFL